MYLKEPHDLADDYYDELYLLENYRERVENEMHDVKSMATTKLSSIIHPTYVNEIADLISYGYQNDNPSAEKIAHALNLGYMDFMAIDGNFDEFDKLRKESHDIDRFSSCD